VPDYGSDSPRRCLPLFATMSSTCALWAPLYLRSSPARPSSPQGADTSGPLFTDNCFMCFGVSCLNVRGLVFRCLVLEGHECCSWKAGYHGARSTGVTQASFKCVPCINKYYLLRLFQRLSRNPSSFDGMILRWPSFVLPHNICPVHLFLSFLLL